MILRGDFFSDTLRMTSNIQVLIPDQGKEPYRIAYLFHGLHGDQGTWLDYTMLPYFAKNFNTIFVMPEVGRSFYLNLKYGRKYYDYVSDELPRICRKNFNISADRENTAVMGCSMGGYASLLLALTRPDQFGFCGAISSALLDFKKLLKNLINDPQPYLDTGAEAEATYADLRCMYGEELGFRQDLDIPWLVENFPADTPKPMIYSTCGTEDELRKGNIELTRQMKNTDFNYTYEEWPGIHDWYFFNDALKKTLEFWEKN